VKLTNPLDFHKANAKRQGGIGKRTALFKLNVYLKRYQIAHVGPVSRSQTRTKNASALDRPASRTNPKVASIARLERGGRRLPSHPRGKQKAHGAMILEGR